MEALKISSTVSLKMLFSNSLFTCRFQTKDSKKRNQVRYNTNNRSSPFPNYSRLPNKRRFIVCAYFGRTTSRRNSLRKKLIESQENLVRHVPHDTQEHSSLNLDGSDIASVEKVGSSLEEPNSKPIGDSVLFNKLENWVDQYKRDTEFWGLGSGPIFTVYQSSDGNLEKISIDKDEILRRSLAREGDPENLAEANSKILKAESLAREMESGRNVIPRNSSVAKFVVQGNEASFWNASRSLNLSPNVVKEVPKVGLLLLYGLVAVWALKKLLDLGNKKEVSLTGSEKEMMRRKIKSRKGREVFEKDGVEVVQEPSKPPVFVGEKPKLDKQELMKNIVRATKKTGNFALSAKSSSEVVDVKIREIQKMAREVREIERVNKGAKSDESEDSGEAKSDKEKATDCLPFLVNGGEEEQSSKNLEVETTLSLDNEAFGENGNVASPVEISDIHQAVSHLTDKDATFGDSRIPGQQSHLRAKPRIIRSVKEAREYLSKKRHIQEEPRSEAVSNLDYAGGKQQEKVVLSSISDAALDYIPETRVSEDSTPEDDEMVSTKNRKPESDQEQEDVSEVGSSNWLSDEQYGGDRQQDKVFASSISDTALDYIPETRVSEDSTPEDDELVTIKNRKPESGQEQEDESDDESSETGLAVKEKWNEENVSEQIAKTISTGFRENYMAAREKKSSPAAVSSLEELKTVLDMNELDWMEDNRLVEIVFRVRENELAGRDPFHEMDVKEKDLFFEGLEQKVERESEKLSILHDWLHSNIENLDYGADGISVYDQPEKIIPRWKGPILEKSPEFLNNFEEQRKAIFAENANILRSELNEEQINLIRNTAASSSENNPKTKPRPRNGQASSKTVIESSDGSVKPGKKSGKEFWQHTKKWSRGFVESYNAEADPEMKSTMRDIGKDLDRWITEKEIQEAADLMDKLPEPSKEFIDKKLNKLKREMELYGPQAVLSKYREYADDDEEDHLWWLDLPHVLCIEIYTVEGDEKRVGFYSLEMATDLELEPKPHHVIAFEDANDCKNLCYLIQAQLEMHGTGHAFVIAQPPKDAFRDATQNGFNVTVIRKGELKLDVDLPLEEAEEQICEIGSKMYHDAIMRERNIDMSTLTKGVFGFKGRPTRAKRKPSKKMLKKRHGKK